MSPLRANETRVASALRVLTYNVRYFAHMHPVPGASSTRRGLHAIAEALATLDPLPHVIALQEVEERSLRSRPGRAQDVGTDDQMRALTRALERRLAHHERPHRYRAHHQLAHRYGLRRLPLYTTGLAWLVRGDVEVLDRDHREVTHRRARSVSALKQSRLCMHLRVDWAGQPIDLFNTHISLPAFFSPRTYRGPARMGWGFNQEREIESVARFVEERVSSDRFLLMGDFNSLPESPVDERLQQALGVRNPFPYEASTWPTAGFLHLRMRLDHVFAGPGLCLEDHSGSHPFGAPSRWRGLSDHVPLVGRFTGA
ncbi:MAG: endonuclease/exonuclease/phosphatase family protein [Myxococcota bacterium]